MRRDAGKLRLEVWTLAAALLASGMALAQMQEPPAMPAPPGQNSGRVPFGQGQQGQQGDDPIMRRAQTEAARRQNADRQKKMVADTDKILRLAEELNVAVDKAIDKGEKDALPASEAKKVEEIEKLARSVKDRMRMD